MKRILGFCAAAFATAVLIGGGAAFYYHSRPHPAVVKEFYRLQCEKYSGDFTLFSDYSAKLHIGGAEFNLEAGEANKALIEFAGLNMARALNLPKDSALAIDNMEYAEQKRSKAGRPLGYVWPNVYFMLNKDSHQAVVKWHQQDGSYETFAVCAY